MHLLFTLLFYQSFSIETNLHSRNHLIKKSEDVPSTKQYICIGQSSLEECKSKINDYQSLPESDWLWFETIGSFSPQGTEEAIYVTNEEIISGDLDEITFTLTPDAIITLKDSKVVINQNKINNLISQAETTKIILEPTSNKCIIECITSSINFDFTVSFTESTYLFLKLPQEYPKNKINIKGEATIYIHEKTNDYIDIFNTKPDTINFEVNTESNFNVTFYSDDFNQCYEYFTDHFNQYFDWTDSFETVKEHEKISTSKQLVIFGLKSFSVSMDDEYKPSTVFIIGNGITATIDLQDKTRVIYHYKTYRTGIELVGEKPIVFIFQDTTSKLILKAKSSIYLDANDDFTKENISFVPNIEIISDLEKVDIVPSLQFYSLVAEQYPEYRMTIGSGLTISSPLPHYLGSSLGSTAIEPSSTCLYLNEEGKSLCGTLNSISIDALQNSINVVNSFDHVVIATGVNTTFSIPESLSKNNHDLYFISPTDVYSFIPDVSNIYYYANQIEINDKYKIIGGQLFLNILESFVFNFNFPKGYAPLAYPVFAVINNEPFADIKMNGGYISGPSRDFSYNMFYNVGLLINSENSYGYSNHACSPIVFNYGSSSHTISFYIQSYDSVYEISIFLLFIHEDMNDILDIVNIKITNYERICYSLADEASSKCAENDLIASDFSSLLLALQQYPDFEIKVCKNLDIPASTMRSFTLSAYDDTIQVKVPPPKSLVISGNDQIQFNFDDSTYVKTTNKMILKADLKNSIELTVNDKTQSSLTFNLLSDILISTTDQITAEFSITVVKNNFHLYALDVGLFGSIFGDSLEMYPVVCAYESGAESLCTVSGKETIQNVFKSPFNYKDVELALSSNSIELNLPTVTIEITVKIATDTATLLTINSVSDLKITSDSVVINDYWRFTNKREILTIKLNKQSSISISGQISSQIIIQMTDAESTIDLKNCESQSQKLITINKFGQDPNEITVLSSSESFNNFNDFILSHPDVTLSLKEGNKYLCICKDELSCEKCHEGIEGQITNAETLNSDPGENVEIRVFSESEISSSVFTNEHIVIANAKLTLNEVSTVYQNVENQLKCDNLIFLNGHNLIVKSKNSKIELILGKGQECHEFTIEFSQYLVLDATNSNDEGVVASKLFVNGNGELNLYNYPSDKIEASSTVKVIKGAYLVCNSKKGDDDICSYKSLDYKLLNLYDDFNNNFDANSKIYVVLSSFSKDVEVEVDKFSHQNMLFLKKTTSSSSHLLVDDGSAKLKFLSTKTLTNKEDLSSELDGSTGGVSLLNDDSDSFIVGFDDKLTIKQEGNPENLKQITIQPKSDSATVVIDENVKIEKRKIKIISDNENQKLTVYVGNKENKDDVKDFFEKPSGQDNIQIEIKEGEPPVDDGEPSGGGKSSDGGLSGGQIAGIVIGVIAFVAIVAAVIVIVIRKKRASMSDSENSGGNTVDL